MDRLIKVALYRACEKDGQVIYGDYLIRKETPTFYAVYPRVRPCTGADRIASGGNFHEALLAARVLNVRALEVVA